MLDRGELKDSYLARSVGDKMKKVGLSLASWPMIIPLRLYSPRACSVLIND